MFSFLRVKILIKGYKLYVTRNQTHRHQTHFYFFQKATNTTKEHFNKMS